MSSPSEKKESKSLTKEQFQQNLSDEKVQLGIQMALQTIQDRYKKQEIAGLSTISFFVGVSNLAFSCYFFGHHPEKVWLLYLLKMAILVPISIYRKFKQNNQYYFMEVCWFSNPILWISTFLLFVCDKSLFSEIVRVQIFRICFSIATGPIAWSVALLGNKMVFHSIDNILSLFIHLTPQIVFYVLRWKYYIIIEYYPGAYSLGDDFMKIDGYQALYFPALKVYMIWWIIYVVWMFLKGWNLDLKYGCVLHEHYKHPIFNSVQSILGGKNEGQTRIKGMLLAFGHLLLSLIFYNWSIVCWYNENIHFYFISLMLLVSIWNASKYYLFILGPVYIKDLKALTIQDKKKQ